MRRGCICGIEARLKCAGGVLGTWCGLCGVMSTDLSANQMRPSNLTSWQLLPELQIGGALEANQSIRLFASSISLPYFNVA